MKKALLFVIGLMLTSTLLAGPVGKEEAKAKALTFLGGKVGTAEGRAKAPLQQELSLASTGDAYHVFNIGSNGGFVIVSASDLTPDVIGYTDEGAFDANNIPDNMKAWLQGYADQIEWVEKNGESAASESVMRKAPAGLKAPIAPLIKTKWDQDAPYNSQVPTGCATGCVATAMAQVLYYHNRKSGYPTGITKDIASYDDGNGHTVATCLAAEPIDWGNMQLTYKDSETTTEEKDAVAKLMKYCGASVKMKYGPSSSSNLSKVFSALSEYFGMTDQRVRHLDRMYYTTAEWENIMYGELAAARPVLYSGTDSDGAGHAFVCDGYSEDGYFHFNWGWSGNGNGYYLLNVVNPHATGIGAGTADDGYTLAQDILIGIEKPVGEYEKEEGRLTVSSVSYGGSSTLGKTSSVTINASFGMRSWLSYEHEFEFALGLFDKDDNLMQTSEVEPSYTLAKGVGFSAYPFSKSLDFSGLEDGKTYTIKPVSRFKGDTKWLKCKGVESYYIKLVAGVSDVAVSAVTPTVSLVASNFTPVVCQKGELTTVTATIQNNGSSYHGELYFFLQGISEFLSANYITVEAGEKGVASFAFKYAGEAPKYTKMRITTDALGNEEIGIADLEIKGTSGETDNTSTLIATHKLNLDGSNILGTKLVDVVTFTNTSTTKAYDGRVYLVVYEWKGGTGHPTTTDVQRIFIPANSSINVTFEKDVTIGKKYSVQAYYRYNSSYDIAMPDVATTEYEACPAVVTYAVNGTKTFKKAETEYTVPSTAAAVDLRGLSGVVTSLNTTSANPNCLYIADFAPISGIAKNWVNGATADNIVLTDGNDFYTPIDFTATKISYTRTFTTGADGAGNGWNTIILPFDVTAVKQGSKSIGWFTSSSDTDKDFWLYQFLGDGKGTVNFDHTSIMMANTPYLIAMPSDHWGAAYDLTDKAITFEGASAKIKAGGKNTQSGVYYMFAGGSQKQTVTNSFVLNAEGNKFAKTTGEVPAFRAYFYPSSQNLQATALTISFVGNNEATGIVELKDSKVEELNSDDSWYTINGVKLTGEPTEKGVYIRNGRKYIIQ